ncbi:43498_t:CDS:1, partial [Gigaspora margarita]
IRTNSELSSKYKNLQVVYSKFSKNIHQKNAQLCRDLNQADTDKKKLSKHAFQLIDKVK